MATPENDHLALLKSAARTKHLFRPHSPDYVRGLVGLVRGTGNRVDYKLPLNDGRLPRRFIRQEPWEIEYLYMLGRRARAGILETGRYNGGSALIFSLANDRVPIVSIDIAPQDDKRLLSLLSGLKVGSNLKLIVGDSQRTKYPEIGDVDLLFVDGDHSFDGCYSDLTNWYGNVLPGGSIVLHDCYFGNEVQDAVLQFIDRHDVEIVVSPYKLAEHGRYPEGSLCHLRKRLARS